MSKPQSPLQSAYVERRTDLVRFFRLRLKSTEAAEDLVQDMFVRIAELSERDIKSPVAYLYRLGWNMMLDRLRQQRRSAARDEDWASVQQTVVARETVFEAPSAEHVVVGRERLASLVKALDALPPMTQRIFRLHKFEGLSHLEVAEALGVSRSAVEKHVSAALKHLLKQAQ